MLDQYFVNLNNQLKAGSISDKEYTEKYMAYSNTLREQRYNDHGMKAPEIINFDMWATDYKPQTVAEQKYMGGEITQTQYVSDTKAGSPRIDQPIAAVNNSVLTGSGNIVTDGRADTTTKSPILLLVIAFIVLLFID